MATTTCPRCHDQSSDPNDCSECGAPMAAVSIAPTDTAATGTNASARQSQIARVGGYSDLTQRIPARRPQATTARFTGTRTGTMAGTDSTRHRGTRGTSSRRRALGGGLVQMPSIPSQDPLLRVLSNPSVPDSKCQCPNPACVDRNGVRTQVSSKKRFCSNCGTEYNFRPSLKAGDIVAGQYEIKGAMAFGGLGWIYLGQDRKVNDRWVVLKGLLNTKDAASAAAAVAERQFLSSIKHGKIVGIYNFVSHGGESYIVMEYVGGRTLKELRKEGGPIPAEQAVSYIIGILPAFAYLHEQKFVYCDFSSDNLMLEGEDVKLIDLGATRRIGDRNGDIFGKEGYMAPEAKYDPCEPSDLFTVGRTLANLLLDMSMRMTGPLNWTAPDSSFSGRGVDLSLVKSWTAALEGGAPLPSWLNFNEVTHTFTGQAPSGTLQIAVEVSALDGGRNPLKDKDSRPATVPMDIVMPLAFPEPQDARLDVPQAAFAKAGLDVSGIVSWEPKLIGGMPFPAWLRWDPNRVMLSGRAPDGVTRVDVEITGTDASGRTATIPFCLRLPFAENESLYRLLLKATAYDVDARFQTAEEMMGQLTGVLREMVSRAGPVPAADDPDFLREKPLAGKDSALAEDAWRRLPDLRIDEADTARNEVFAAGGANTSEERSDILVQAASNKADSSEARLRRADLLIEQWSDRSKDAGGAAMLALEAEVMPLLDQAAAIDTWDWRPDWYCGVLRLSQGQADGAVECFDRVYGDIPGSVPPKLALAMALEMAGRLNEAAGLYDTVSRTNPLLTAAAFGLGRCRMAVGDKQGAVDAYERVSTGSAAYDESRFAVVRALVDNAMTVATVKDVQRSSVVLAAMQREDIPRYVTEVAVLMGAVALLKGGTTPPKDARILNTSFREKDLRLRAEKSLRTCARLAKTTAERVAYVDLANSVRPRTPW